MPIEKLSICLQLELIKLKILSCHTMFSYGLKMKSYFKYLVFSFMLLKLK